MRRFTRMLVIAALLLSPARSVLAQTAVDPSGHWEGKVEAPNMDMRFEIDLAKNTNGELAGTLSVPAQELKGLRLLTVAAEGKSINFHARRDQTFSGDLSDDGKSMSGTFAVEGAALPFSLTRTGDARIEPPLKSPAIGKELEGTWNGTLEAGGMVRVVLTMANQSDGTATGHIVNLKEGGLEIPVGITQTGSGVALVPGIGTGAFSGVLNAAGTELAGTWKEGGAEVPLTFRRADK